jgi:hypothetical protein
MQFKTLLLIFLFSYSIYSQDTSELIKLITPESNESKKTESDTEKDFKVTETQKKLIRKVLSTITDREVDDYLKGLGLSTEGSIYIKRERLRAAVNPPDAKVKEDFASLMEKEKDKDKQTSYVIENASEAELLSVDKTKSGVLILRGKVRLKIGNGTLLADSISIDSKRNEIYAEGGINYTDKSLKVIGDKFIYDTKLGRGVIYDTKATLYPAYFVGKKIRKIDEDQYVLDMGHFTACGAEVPHYKFKAKKIIVYGDNSVIATNMWLQVGQTNLFWIPLYYSSNLGSGWTMQFGKNRSQGNFVQGSYQWSEPRSGPSLLMPIGRKIKIDLYQITGQAAAFDIWKVSPWLNYNLETGIANYKFNRIIDGYERPFGVPLLYKTDPIGNPSNVITTNEVDKGEICMARLGDGPCLVNATQLGKSQNPNFNTQIRNIGERNQTWSKINLNLNARSNNIAGDGTRNFQTKIENYSNPFFDFEFGYRYEPSNTIRSLYTRRQQRNPFIRQTQNWSFDFTQTHGDLSVNISARRNFLYQPIKDNQGGDRFSGFYPTYEELPRTSIKNSSQIATLPYFESPIYWDVNVNNVIKRFYGSPVRNSIAVADRAIPFSESSTGFLPSGSYPYGKSANSISRTEVETVAETGFRSTMNFGGYVTFTPSGYTGFQKYTLDVPGGITNANLPRDRDLRRNSYLFTRHNHRMTVGVPALLFSSTFRWTDGRRSELKEETLARGRDRVKELELAIESNALENVEVSVRTARDLREFAKDYNGAPTNAQRWYFTIFRTAIFYDFLDGLGKKRQTLLEKRRSFFSGIFFNNDYVFHTAQKSPLYNNFTISYKMGGFSLPFIRNFKSFEMGGTWFHVFRATSLEQFGVYAGNSGQGGKYNTTRSPFLDSYRFFIQTDIQFTRYFGMELELDSRVTQPWRYTNEVGQDSIFRNSTDAASLNNSYTQYAETNYSSPNTNFQQTTFQKDIANGLGLNGLAQRQTSAFNINRFIWVGKLNVHNFEYRLGYAMDLRAISGGVSLDNIITFYDQSVFFSVNLLNVNLTGEEASAAQSRARLYRFRKRPFDDLGATGGISAE